MKMLAGMTLVGATPFAAFGQGGRSGNLQDAWSAWKSAFLLPEGRIVDALQENASHSEGQAWGVLLATAFGDEDTARRLVDWTERLLAVRRDPLLAWRWRPEKGVTDYNNATDGDLLYAWALLRAARRFGDPAYAERAARIARAIVDIAVVSNPAADGRLLLLPAAERFSDQGAVTINPSYYMPIAMHALAAAFSEPVLARAAEDGVTLLAQIAEDGLVPDWVDVTETGWRTAEPLSFLYGYEALRVPLYLVWSGRFAHPAVQRARDLMNGSAGSPTPVLVEPHSGRIVERSDAPGYAAIAYLITCTGHALPEAGFPAFTPAQSYYPATLHLLAALAALEQMPGCLRNSPLATK